jgi:ACS family tartrate transporter-like MFS transporter
MERAIERRAMRKVYLRLLPFMILTYLLCYVDRINVGFAALTMNKDIGLDPGVFGLAAGAFFWGYFLLEVPSNVILERIGARLWIARIMISWGILSGATAFAVGPISFTVLRFLLGLAEAGLYPGILLYATYWFPDRHRARIMAGLTLALPLAVAIGAPISTALFQLHGLLGLRSWQWMFIGEATPTVLIGFAVLIWVTDRPAQARWLALDERAWLVDAIEAENRRIEAHRKIGVLRSFWDPKVLLLTLNYFGIVTASLGLLIFLPQMIKQLGLTNMQVGWVTMVPYLCGSASMLVLGWLADSIGERRWLLFASCVLAAVGLVMAGETIGTWWCVVGMSLAAMGLYGTKGPFWAMPPMLLTGTAAATGIAWINSVGNLGGFVGPTVVGWARQGSGSFAGGLYALAAFAALSAVVAAVWLHIPRRVLAAAE